MKPPCMIVVQHLLPPLRVAISKKMVEEYGLKKTKVSQLMGLTPAAITQYLNQKRGDDQDFIIQSLKINELVSEITKDLITDESKPDMLLLKMCRICQVARAEGLICKLHMEAMPSLISAQPCACSFGIIELTREA